MVYLYTYMMFTAWNLSTSFMHPLIVLRIICKPVQSCIECAGMHVSGICYGAAKQHQINNDFLEKPYKYSAILGKLKLISIPQDI